MTTIRDFIHGMESALDQPRADLSRWVWDDIEWTGNAGCGQGSGAAGLHAQWQALFHGAFGGLSVAPAVWMEDGDWAARVSTCHAAHVGPFMDLAATGRPLHIQRVDFWQFRDGRVAFYKMDVDLAGIAAQLGLDVFHGKGWDRFDPPVSRLWRGQSGLGAKARPLEIVQAMEDALQRSDVDVSAFFHDDFVWDANFGCGLKHGLQEFETGWYAPFRAFFGNRDFQTVHYMQAGNWAACFGACHATLDKDFMGIKASGQPIRVPYIDFWRIEDRKIAENIVRVDFASIVKQLGGDVFGGQSWETADAAA